MSGDGSVSFEKKIMIDLTAEIVSAYVGNNPVQSTELPSLIRNVHESLNKLAEAVPVVEEQKPAVSVRKSITDDYLICLEDGKKFKSLKRHLRSKYDMSPEEYREKWNLPHDYPMVAPAYARERSRLAKEMGLGQSKK
ncbi:MAG: MucR family transcriptional regulator [Hyphomonadaceae bacterium]|nr:MucR family transcriptional regulator [Hyphomonadaceae bacterium]